ncbi:retinoic acid-induced protein 3-like [Rhineura floridana]|uniref:retinoic acid-induced protein 3-like n=1 Tax=Rhineura floridana TaxID=261503 RepID=UPI002AC88ACD|nr:retinoic acid-induced protein 3-like [Rhineura floridana]
MAATPMAPPPGCGNIDPAYYFLCDFCEAWGIGLETVAAAGILASLALLLAFSILSCMVKDKTKKTMLPTQFFFLLGTLGIFSLTFVFIIRLNKKTGPTRFILHGVLFALCFSCLLTHAFNLVRLVRGKVPYSQLSMLVHALGLTLIQMIIAVKYIIITVERDGIDVDRMGREQRNKDFVMVLTYVLVLMVLTFMISMFTFCGPYKSWKRHGMHIFVTLLFSKAIWAAWITMLLMSSFPGNGAQSKWDDPLISLALVVNGWVFLTMYTVPEICFLATPFQPGDYPPEKTLQKSTATQQSIEAGSTQAPDKEGAEEDVLLALNGNCFHSKTFGTRLCFSIPWSTLHPAHWQDVMVHTEAKEPSPDIH